MRINKGTPTQGKGTQISKALEAEEANFTENIKKAYRSETKKMDKLYN